MGPLNVLSYQSHLQCNDISISLRFTPTTFYRDAGTSILTPRQLMVELFLLTSSRFPLRKLKEKYTLAEIRTLRFRLGDHTLYPPPLERRVLYIA